MEERVESIDWTIWKYTSKESSQYLNNMIRSIDKTMNERDDIIESDQYSRCIWVKVV